MRSRLIQTLGSGGAGSRGGKGEHQGHPAGKGRAGMHTQMCLAPRCSSYPRAPLVFLVLGLAQSRAHLQSKVGANLPRRREGASLHQAPRLGLVVLWGTPLRTGDHEGGLGAEVVVGLCRQIYVQVETFKYN